MLHLLQMSHSKCSLLSFSKFRTFGSSHFWSCPPCCISASSGNNTVTSSSNSSSLYTSTVQSSRSSANAALPPNSRLQTSYPPSAHFVSSTSALSPPPLAPGFFSTPPASSSNPDSLRLFNGMQGVAEPGTLNCYTFFCFILLTLFVSRNLTLIHLPLSGSLDSLLCDLIAPTSGLEHSLQTPRTLAAASSFSSGRAYPSLNFLPPLFLRLTPTLIM